MKVWDSSCIFIHSSSCRQGPSFRIPEWPKPSCSYFLYGTLKPRALMIQFLWSQNQPRSPPSVSPCCQPSSSPLLPCFLAALHILTPPLPRFPHHLCLPLCSRLSSFFSIFNSIYETPAISNLFIHRRAQMSRDSFGLTVLQSPRHLLVLWVLWR